MPDPLVPEVVVLDAVEQRVLGALLEKQRTVPDSYPLSLNGLRGACNQSTSREPVTDYDEPTLVDALGRLRDRELVRFVRTTGLRVVKYHQRLEERLGLDPAGAALIAVLLLRGPQAAGELRTRCERLHGFADRETVEDALAGLAALDPPLVEVLERRAGQHDPRWIHRLGPTAAAESAPATPPAAVDRESVLAEGAPARDRRVAAGYDRLAEAYTRALADELDDKPFDRWLLDRLAEDAAADGSTGGAVPQGLDVGCGPGQVAGHLAGRGLRMTGLDLSETVLAAARERHPDVDFVRGSFAVPPMPRGSDPRRTGWAVVTAWYALVHLAGSELAPTVAALARVVRPGGLLALATHVGLDDHREAVVRPGQMFGVETDLAFVLHDPDALLAAAAAAGLEQLEWYRRGPLPTEAPTERLYLLARRPA